MCHVWVYFTLCIFSFNGVEEWRECRACVTLKGYVLSVSLVLNVDSLEPFAVECWVIKQGKVSLEIMFICLVTELWKLHLKPWSNCIHIIWKPTLQYYGHGGNAVYCRECLRLGLEAQFRCLCEQSLYTIPLIPLCMYITKFFFTRHADLEGSGYLHTGVWRST